MKRMSRTNRKWDGLVADFKLRLKAVMMMFLGRTRAKCMASEECRAMNQSVGNQDARRVDSALETTVNCKSGTGRLSITQGLLFPRSKWLSDD